MNYTFLFPRVGIAVHLKTEEDIKNLEQIINAIYPKSCSIPPSFRKHRKIIIKNINPNITTEGLTNLIQENTQEKVQVRRFHSTYNHQPLPIFCLTSKDTLCHKLLSEGIRILGAQNHFVKYVKTVVLF